MIPMRNPIVTAAVLMMLVGLTTATRALADEPNTLSDAEKADGWKLLFDGKTFNGWSSWKTKQPLDDEKWVVKDGAMTLTGKGAGDIYTTDAFENYEFTVEWKTTGNSGILIRVNPEEKGPIYGVAPEMQIERDTPQSLKSTNAGGLYALYDIAVKEKKINPDGWNLVRIRMVDGHGEHWFNGDKVADYQIGSDDWKRHVLASKFKNAVDKFGMTAKGHIGFQDHGHMVQFRNVKIREVPSGK
ncbi:MAG: DUF1080 domain-containing protein [Phycisphaera sp.]|nr:DUF1080 domain-containing protein [Phycisphaera sp.]